ncbi:MAG TPA: hypothetical protein VF170_15185, partial [Planctomycetaceae bacterium]
MTDRAGRAAWEEYLDRRGGRTLFHRFFWDAAFGTYRLPALRLVAVREGQVSGILPLVRQRSLVFGDRLVSLPWFDAAGVLADTEEDRRALVEAAVRRAEAMGVRGLEIREAEASDLSPHVRTDKVLMRL